MGCGYQDLYSLCAKSQTNVVALSEGRVFRRSCRDININNSSTAGFGVSMLRNFRDNLVTTHPRGIAPQITTIPVNLPTPIKCRKGVRLLVALQSRPVYALLLLHFCVEGRARGLPEAGHKYTNSSRQYNQFISRTCLITRLQLTLMQPKLFSLSFFIVFVFLKNLIRMMQQYLRFIGRLLGVPE